MATPSTDAIVLADDREKQQQQHDADAEWLALRLTFLSSGDMMRVRASIDLAFTLKNNQLAALN